MPMMLSIALFNLLGHSDQKEVQHETFVHPQHWNQPWHHVMLVLLSMGPLHFLD